MFAEAVTRLAPAALGPAAVVAHGDAHDANVWVEADGLRWFDPALAGAHVPALLAEVKPTFHNVWAHHPDQLYHPGEATAGARAERRGDTLHVTLAWSLPAVRARRLASTVEHVWTPFVDGDGRARAAPRRVGPNGAVRAGLLSVAGAEPDARRARRRRRCSVWP